MVFRQRTEAVQARAPEAAEQALARGVRRGGVRRRPEDADTQRGDGRVEPRRVDAVALVEDGPGAVRHRENLPAQRPGPRRRRVTGYVDVHQPAAADLHHDEHIQYVEPRGHHHAGVAREQRVGVVPQERAPAVCGGTPSFSPGPLRHVTAHGPRRHPEAQPHKQFRRDAPLAPGRVLLRHSGDQTAEFQREGWPALPAGSLPPDQAKGLPVPADQRGGLYDEERVSPGKDPGQQNQHQAGRIGCAPGFDFPLPVKCQLFPQEQILCCQCRAGPDPGGTEPQGIDPQRGPHVAEMPQRRNSLHTLPSPRLV